MACHQTRDVLDHVRQYHLALSALYEELKSCAVNAAALELLDYLSRHEKKLEQALAIFMEQVSDNVLDTYFTCESECTHASKIKEYERKAEMNACDVTAAAMYFDTCLVSFCREMAERSVSVKVREVFENMLSMELREQRRLSTQLLDMV